MKKIYFVDHQHELNFNSLLMNFPVAIRDIEYKTACYILSVPMIFEKVEAYIDEFESPVDWIWRYLEWEKEFNEDWRRGYDDELHPEHDAWIERRPYDLTGSMKQLGKLSLNLWTSYEDFNLMKCLSSLDSDNVNVFRCAIDLRLGLIR